MGIERESVLRFEREAQTRANQQKLAQYAAALNMNDPDELKRPPGAISLDGLAAKVPEDQREMAIDMAADVLKRFAAGRR